MSIGWNDFLADFEHNKYKEFDVISSNCVKMKAMKSNNETSLPRKKGKLIRHDFDPKALKRAEREYEKYYEKIRNLSRGI